ncbi:MAG: hypothetical protein ACREHG_05055 [Candidatus Saccharimonadales bacterium]
MVSPAQQQPQIIMPQMTPPTPPPPIQQPQGSQDKFKQTQAPTFLSSAAQIPPSTTGRKTLLGQ